MNQSCNKTGGGAIMIMEKVGGWEVLFTTLYNERKTR